MQGILQRLHEDTLEALEKLRERDKETVDDLVWKALKKAKVK